MPDRHAFESRRNPNLRHQAGRVQAAQRQLACGRHRTGPWCKFARRTMMIEQPAAGVESVFGVGQIFDECSFGTVTAACVLVDDSVNHAS